MQSVYKCSACKIATREAGANMVNIARWTMRHRRTVIVGGKDGYVGRDGQVPAGEEERVRALHDLGGS